MEAATATHGKTLSVEATTTFATISVPQADPLLMCGGQCWLRCCCFASQADRWQGVRFLHGSSDIANPRAPALRALIRVRVRCATRRPGHASVNNSELVVLCSLTVLWYDYKCTRSDPRPLVAEVLGASIRRRSCVTRTLAFRGTSNMVARGHFREARLYMLDARSCSNGWSPLYALTGYLGRRKP
eukprot:scaffold160098_cov30-Tisochrysis_lutea.AAC.2